MKPQSSQAVQIPQGGVRGASNALGVILVNLGTPDAPNASAIRRYLREFLGDRRVVEAPRWLWWFILNLVILPLRPFKLVRNYRGIWGDQDGPIRAITRTQAQKLQAQLIKRFAGHTVQVESAMTYGNPSLAGALDKLRQQGIRRIVVIPLYPQYSATTTAATWDALMRATANIRDLPEIRFVRSYHNHPVYIEALAQSVRAHWEQKGRRGKLLFSFHGIPQSYADKGDPYPEACAETAQRVADALNLTPRDWLMTFQSRFGAAPWLQPYTDKTVERLGREGLKALDVICPGFAADCLETLEEINEENRAIFLGHGGKDFQYIPALNETDLHIKLLRSLVEDQVQCWWPVER